MEHRKTISRKRRKVLFVERFGGKCEICGYNKCVNSLVFHHLDPILKEETPQKIIYNGTVEKAEKELKKCILVCANCHGEIHSKEYNFDYRFKDIKPFHTLKCEFCKKEYSTKDPTSKYCSEKCFRMGSRKVLRPTKRVLEKLLKKNSFLAVGRLYGVSDNTIRKWLK